MELGLEFDDDDLDSARDKNRNDTCLPYVVKMCSPQWFELAVESYQSDLTCATEMDPQQVPHMFKFSGDFHYHQKNYEKAAEQYKCALDLLPENNVSVRQDVKESLCRCYMYCGQINESLQIARNLVTEMSTEDEAHQRQSLILLAAVCEKGGRWAECVDCLEKLCIQQTGFAQWWEQLGDAYTNLSFDSQTAEDDMHGRGEAVIIGEDHSTIINLVKPLTCYIRASLLLQAVLGTASSFIKSRNSDMLSKISKKIDSILLSEDEKAFALQHIKGEIENQEKDFQDKLENNISKDVPVKDSYSDVPSLSCSQMFYTVFCSWYQKAHT